MRYVELLEPPCRAVLSLKVAPTEEPVTPADLAVHSRIDIVPESTYYLAGLLAAARRDIELLTGRQLITATFELYLDAWPGSDYIEFPRPPLQSVASVEYRNSAGSFSTFSSSLYTVTAYTATDPNAPPGRLELKPSESWPTLDWEQGGGIRVTFIAGYGAAAAVPAEAKQAIYVQAAEMYERREAGVVGTIYTPVARVAERIVAGLRVF